MKKHDLQSYLEFMIRIEASSRRELAEADLIDKNAKPYNLPTEEMERLYMSNGRFKPPAKFQTCVKCGHNLVDEPAQNKSAVRENKRVSYSFSGRRIPLRQQIFFRAREFPSRTRRAILQQRLRI